MINFRYHIVSLMAVFMALAVGIAVGVSLSPSVDESILKQAQQDRDQVTALRTELDRRAVLDSYRSAYDQRTASLVLAGELTDYRVAIVAMPDAPGAVVTAVDDAVTAAGGRVVTQVDVSSRVVDPAQAAKVEEDVAPLEPVGLTSSMSPATKVGWSLARSIASKQMTTRDEYARSVGRTLASTGLVDVQEDVDDYAQLVVVVTAASTTQTTDSAVTTADVELQTALKEQGGAADTSVGVVVAGPNSAGLPGTDVGAIRVTSPGSSELSTVDVADLPSGVVTTVLAGREQVLGRQGHYGALARADDALPTLPIR